ncbi:M20 metallopeptidase family protein [Salipaludibacillus aurantiacus]|uniref:Amidohydrolase n=1 Tax=Salipaludibacillus aurantiacus TaxID=1601833 RepID=A0A1H9VY75_9BACI|nr:M20 family metallopeptidase [Salipaludibacillus aurantiacus]SES26464.1 amidohydrolase [Salipaludibacillus aurantiacus]
MDIHSLTSEIIEEIIQIRRHLHRFPELSMEEFETTQLIMDTLKGTNIQLEKMEGGTGVIGVLRGKSNGPTLGLRADIDALPIYEKTGLEFKSEKEGIMHACGHDIHTSVMLGTALVMNRFQDQLKGNIKFIFQPAEEIMEGARFVINQGILDQEPKVDKIVCLHTWPLIEAGTIGVRHGPIMAAADKFSIEIDGSGGHAAHPHIATDPIPVAAQIIMGLQTIISRQISPLDSAVLTIGQIHGGNADNIIANKVTISGSIRTLEPEVRNSILKDVTETSEYIAKASKTSAAVNFEPGCPPVINDDELVDALTAAVESEMGKESLVYLEQPSLGGEDFAFYLQEIEGMLFRVGTKDESNEQTTRSLHNPGIIFDEKAVKAGIKAMSALSLEYLK